MATLMDVKANYKRKHDVAENSESSEEENYESDASEIEETPEEKRRRIAEIYLEELQRKEAEENENVSHEDINAKLRQQELEANQKIIKLLADKFDSCATPTLHKDKNHQKPLTALAIHDNMVFTASKDGSIVKWNLDADGNLKMVLRKKSKSKEKDPNARNHNSIINCMATNGTFLATGDDSKLVYVWKCDTLEFVKYFQGHRGPITGLTFARNKNVLYSCSKDRSVKTWDLDQRAYVETLFGHQDTVSCITSGVSCDFITGGGRDGTVRLWKTTEEVQLVFNQSGGASIEAIDKINAELFVTVGDNGQISLWSTRKKTPLCCKSLAHDKDQNGVPNWISAMAVLKCSDFVATGSNDGQIRLWKIDPKTKVIEEKAQVPVAGFVNSLAFTEDGKYLLAAVGQEHRLGRWWRLKEAKNTLICIPIQWKTE